MRFEPQSGVRVLLKGQPVTAAIDLKDDDQPNADELVIGDVRLVIHLSGEKRSLRVRDPNGEPAHAFQGFKWFPVDEKYRVVGRFIKDAQPSEDEEEPDDSEQKLSDDEVKALKKDLTVAKKKLKALQAEFVQHLDEAVAKPSPKAV